MEKDKLSVIIPCYDHHELSVVHVRESISSNRTPDEVIVVNDGGDPRLLEMLRVGISKELKKKTKIMYARIEQDILWNYPGAVNLGTWLSTGGYLAYEDNDNIPHREFYDLSIQLLKDKPNVGRVCATKRLRTSQWEMLTKPYEEWRMLKKGIGPNMGTCMMNRDVIIKLKGQDERFSGGYGWMYIDWSHRMRAKAGIEFDNIGFYWYALDPWGQSKLSRNKKSSNLSVRRENCRSERLHSNHPMLNFTYEYHVL